MLAGNFKAMKSNNDFLLLIHMKNHKIAVYCIDSFEIGIELKNDKLVDLTDLSLLYVWIK